MGKEKLFVVLSHKHSLKKGSNTVWETNEKLEFVNNLRPKHYSMSSAIGDYINRKMIIGERAGLGNYNEFESFITRKYEKQMAELDSAYKSFQIEKAPDTITDQFGNVRLPTIFD
jgi:hypothetical protein